MKKVFALLLSLCLLLTATGALAEGKLILGSNCSFPPFESIDDQGNPTGFDIEISRLVAQKMGKELEVMDMSFDGLLLALQGGQIDMVAAAMTIRPDRQEQADFSNSYFNAQQKVIVRKGYEAIKSVEDIKDKYVAVQDGTTGYYMATDTLGLASDHVAAFKNAADAILELKSGRVDCVIIDTAPANVFVSLNDDLVILEDIVTDSEDYGIAVAKGNVELLTAINEVLDEIKANGVYDELIAKYFAQ